MFVLILIRFLLDFLFKLSRENCVPCECNVYYVKLKCSEGLESVKFTLRALFDQCDEI